MKKPLLLVLALLAASPALAASCDLSDSDFSALKKSKSKLSDEAGIDALSAMDQKRLCDTRQAINALSDDSPLPSILKDDPNNPYLSSDERMKVKAMKLVENFKRKTMSA